MKIAKFGIKDFRAFPSPESYEFDLGATGKNLLLYGENGSGKSSLFLAFVEYFNLNPAARPFASFKNKFSGNALRSFVDGSVKLQFIDGTDLEWPYFGLRPTADPRIADAALRKAFLDYRSLLKTSFVEGPLSSRLFALSVELLLRNVPVTLRGEPERNVGYYWDRVVARRPPTRYATDIRYASYAANQFNDAFRAILPAVQSEVQRLLSYFHDPWLQIEIDFPGLRLDKDIKDYLNQELHLHVKFRGASLDDHVLFLNEARLSALALSLYFAAARLSNPSPPAEIGSPLKLLILDDVLIGLDMANRLPVLDLLETEFVAQEWQVFLLTFDRAWYEVAKQRLHNDKWSFSELYAVRVGNHEQPVLVRDRDPLERAVEFLSEGEVKAAAVHVRTEFERILKKACHELKISVPYNSSPIKVQASTLWGALKAAHFFLMPAKASKSGSHGQVHIWQPKQQDIRYIPSELATRIDHSVSWILNPLSHAHSIELYRREIEEAIYAISDLRRTMEQAISGQLQQLTEKREILLRLVKHRSTP